MIQLDLIADSSIVLCPVSLKKRLLPLLNKTDKRVKFLSKSDLLRSAFFQYGDPAIAALYEKGYSYPNAKEILENLYFLRPGNEKINALSAIRKELEEKNLLEIHADFFRLFDAKSVYLSADYAEDKEVTGILKEKGIDYRLLEEENGREVPEVIEYEEAETEVDQMFNALSALASSGVDLNRIKIFRYGSEYDLLIRRYADLYRIPVHFDLNMSLFQSPYFDRFLKKYDESSLREAYASLAEEIQTDRFGFLNRLKSVVRSIDGLFPDRNTERRFLIDKAKDTALEAPRYLHGVDLVDASDVDDDYIFVLGFNLLAFPRVKKDVSYLNDEEKAYLGRNTASEENRLEEAKLIRFLRSHRHLYLSYKKKHGKDVFYPSLLIEKLSLPVRKGAIETVRYSFRSGKIRVGKEKDLKKNFGIVTPFTNAMSDEELDYRTYDRRFHSFPELKGKRVGTISYSQINRFALCPFGYYLDNVLKLNDREETFAMKLGTFFHRVLEESLNRDEFDREKYLAESDALFPHPREKHFARKLLDRLSSVDALNRKFIGENPRLSFSCEKKLTAAFDENHLLYGVVDKIVFSEQDRALFIVDYKTGDAAFDKEKVGYGLSLQLPLYAFLVKANYPEYDQSGIYIQNVLSPDESGWRLKGITKNNLALIGKFDPALSSSSAYFYGVGLLKDGNLRRSKTLIDEAEWDAIVAEGVGKVREIVREIEEGNFAISPAFVVGERSGACSFCAYKAICFKEKSDERRIELTKEEEENA